MCIHILIDMCVCIVLMHSNKSRLLRRPTGLQRSYLRRAMGARALALPHLEVPPSPLPCSTRTLARHRPASRVPVGTGAASAKSPTWPAAAACARLSPPRDALAAPSGLTAFRGGHRQRVHVARASARERPRAVARVQRQDIYGQRRGAHRDLREQPTRVGARLDWSTEACADP